MRLLKTLSRFILGGLLNVLVFLAKRVGPEKLFKALNRPQLLSCSQKAIQLALGKKIRFQDKNLQRILCHSAQKLVAIDHAIATNTLRTAIISATLTEEQLNTTQFHHLEAIQNLEGSILFVGAHINNWEVCRRNLDQLGFAPAYLYKDFQDDWFDHRRINRKARHGDNGIATSNTKQFIKHLAGGGHGYMLLDIKDKSRNGLKVPLCGVPAWTSSLPAQLAINHNVSIVPVVLRYGANGFEQSFMKPIDTSSHDPKAITCTLNAAIGNAILEAPEQWLLWDTNRWGL